MKFFRVCVLLLFVVTFGVCAGLYVHLHLTVDSTYPTIEIANDTVMLTANGSGFDSVLLSKNKYSANNELFTGVTAHDEKDGDITEKVFIESSSAFTEPGECTITYAVCDSDNHITRVQRKLVYTNYTSPEFYLKDDLVFTIDEELNLSEIIGATDVIYGDISSDVIITVPDYEYGKTGSFSIHVEVSNEKTDSSHLDLPVVIEDSNRGAPVIALEKYLIYIDKGESFNPRSYVKSALDSEGNPIDAVTYKSGVKSDTSGVYSVDFYAKDSLGVRGHSVLLVVVR